MPTGLEKCSARPLLQLRRHRPIRRPTDFREAFLETAKGSRRKVAVILNRVPAVFDTAHVGLVVTDVMRHGHCGARISLPFDETQGSMSDVRMPVLPTPTTPRCMSACGRDRVPLRPRLLASKAGDDASTKETASSSALMSQSAIVLYVPTSQVFRYWQAAACSRAVRKSATYRSPRSPILAALVPSVGTMMLQIKEFGSPGGAHERPGIRASSLTDPCVSSKGKEIRAPQ
jgi:hypothetical protein